MLTGESYAGKFLGIFSHEILKYNKKVEKPLPLEVVFVNDPYPAPESQRSNMHVIPAALDLLDDGNLDQISLLEQRC